MTSCRLCSPCAQLAAFEAALDATLDAVPDGAAEDQGVALGAATAAQILDLRSADHSGDIVPYTPGSDPGDWIPTPTGLAPALLPGWGLVTPFAMTSGDQFRPAAPPGLTDPAYTDRLQRGQGPGLGDQRHAARADQTDIALFWANGGGTATPPGH